MDNGLHRLGIVLCFFLVCLLCVIVAIIQSSGHDADISLKSALAATLGALFALINTREKLP